MLILIFPEPSDYDIWQFSQAGTQIYCLNDAMGCWRYFCPSNKSMGNVYKAHLTYSFSDYSQL